MSPVVLEAVYERLPVERQASAFRFGVRAQLGGSAERIGERTEPSRPAREAQRSSSGAAPPARAKMAALPGPGAAPVALAYGPQGQVFPLPTFPPLSPHRGAHLDVFG